jgi:hypothetical protein
MTWWSDREHSVTPRGPAYEWQRYISRSGRMRVFASAGTREPSTIKLVTSYRHVRACALDRSSGATSLRTARRGPGMSSSAAGPKHVVVLPTDSSAFPISHIRKHSCSCLPGSTSLYLVLVNNVFTDNAEWGSAVSYWDHSPATL